LNAPVVVESLDHEGRGVAHADGKAIFIDGALPGETVSYAPYRKKSSFEFAQIQQIHRSSFVRTAPRCAYFGVCGGCSMQHADWLAQVAAKQRVLEENLKRIGKVEVQQLLPPIYGIPWGYRQRARLSVKFVIKKDAVLVGFREKRNPYVADMHGCETLDARIARLIDPLRELIHSLDIRELLPQIEAAAGERIVALVLRVMQEPSASDFARLRAFADAHRVQYWLQRGGPESVAPFYPMDAPALDYSLPDLDLRLCFGPTEFTQVNFAVNRVLVRRALQLLQPQPGERITDLFCGLGNFTLAIARHGARVTGVEGNAGAIERARNNARLNALEALVQFKVADLYKADAQQLAQFLTCDKLLIDPPRDGAFAVAKALPDGAYAVAKALPEGTQAAAPNLPGAAEQQATLAPKRILYVSCNPATLARDAAVLVHEKGYVLASAGIVNMFPHTAHVESIACFERV
jgi:23S rRNA (uracil1939-C5)-methyltransferase